jgi:hypothetical protein
MLVSKKQSGKSKAIAKPLTVDRSPFTVNGLEISTAEAFYRLYRTLPKRDRLKVAQYLIKDGDIQHGFDQIQIPNETTLKSFGEDKSVMPEFHSVDELRKDLLS